MKINKVQNNISFGRLTNEAKDFFKENPDMKNSFNQDTFERLKKDEHVELHSNGEEFILSFTPRALMPDSNAKVNHMGGFEFPVEALNSSMMSIYEVMSDNAKRYEHKELNEILDANNNLGSTAIKAQAHIGELSREINEVSDKYTNQEKAHMVSLYNDNLAILFKSPRADKDSFEKVN